MKDVREIWNKIDELTIKRDECTDDVELENICCKIDALLWVVGDISGKEI